MLKRKVEEEYICDRCKKRINNIFPIIRYTYKSTKLEELLFGIPNQIKEPLSFIGLKKYENNEDGAEIIINNGKSIEIKQFDLCPKCKRAFKKFMKWDGDEECNT